MTNEDLLDQYLKNVEEEKEKLKNEISIYFDLNKNEKNIKYLISQKFDDKINVFKETYIMSVPERLLNTSFAYKSTSKTIEICLDLMKFSALLVDKITDDN